MRCKASIEKSQPTIDFSHSFEMTEDIGENPRNSCHSCQTITRFVILSAVERWTKHLDCARCDKT